MAMFWIALLTFFASAAGTLTGFGTSTIMVTVLVLFFPLPEVLLFVGLVHFFDDIWKLMLFREGIRWRTVLLFGLPGVVMSWVGALIVVRASDFFLPQLLGVFLVGYFIFIALRPAFKFKPNALMVAAGGASSGFLAGILGVGGLLRALFLSAFDFPKAVYIATSGAIALMVDGTRLTTYLYEGTELADVFLWGLIAFIPASFFGSALAKRVVNRIPQKKFRLVVGGALFIIGLKLIFLG